MPPSGGCLAGAVSPKQQPPPERWETQKRSPVGCAVSAQGGTVTASGYGVGLLSQESVPERDQRGRSVGASLRGVVAAAECVEQVCAVGGHQ